MKVDATVVRLVADLAQLHLDPADLEEQINSMNRILGLVESMNAVNTDGVQPMANPLDATQRLREDVVTETDQSEQFQSIAPETEDRLYLVPRYVE
ncbi:MAG: Asp-tRNA(Asn)/Glu-tRNA(Gln) amidotransferase GatCAB subunit C [Gammaproteobacteria bacterium]|mgnify:FL=1|nr:Asp-tRNA(Asn)/Glu-tRNA(Gln) amidotransferase GatCAB subunit C [Gammaproteobacteria bacterium]MBS03911.1 Asp-tRNA(Asn)/Glu-tRNA(Gln) amidotransferase GatCAB subunit C [Gammaproteobacteria bacterium]